MNGRELILHMISSEFDLDLEVMVQDIDDEVNAETEVTECEEQGGFITLLTSTTHTQDCKDAYEAGIADARTMNAADVAEQVKLVELLDILFVRYNIEFAGTSPANPAGMLEHYMAEVLGYEAS